MKAYLPGYQIQLVWGERQVTQANPPGNPTPFRDPTGLPPRYTAYVVTLTHPWLPHTNALDQKKKKNGTYLGGANKEGCAR